VAIAFVKCTELTGGTNSASGTVSATAGNALIVVLLVFAPSTNVFNSATGGGTWTINVNGTASSLATKVGIASCPSATGGSNTMTFNFAGGSGVTAFVAEFSGLKPSGIFEAAGTDATGTSTTPATGALTNTQATAVKVAGAVIDATNNTAWTSTGSGYVLPTNGSEPDGVTFLIAALSYKICSVSASDTETWSRAGSNPWRGNQATYLDTPVTGLPPGLGPHPAMDALALNMQSQAAMMR
jgi:hypothetical protein